ncbi:phosphate starvation-inducible protein PhoH [Nocardiopsis sinuspersici]|uniref:PhoH-like protein n=1 Tax=Nocardiopsis sinuspersici TaxID=501010 RepID=A0A1V3BWW1_9ACTN|nr:phosphate starvation-inducible protein PhoH [Nocardiopsis sinuspersici]
MSETTHTHSPRDTQVKVVVPDEHTMISLLGSGDELLRALERAFDSDIHVRGHEFTISGTPEETAVVVRLVEELIELVKSGTHVTPDTIERMVHMLGSPGTERPAEVLTTNILSNRGRTIRPKTVNQKRYVDTIDRHTVVFGIGPAGTGKTYLAMAKAVRALQDKEINRIILTRPAVEAGERLGFLPGSLYDKIDPYLRPLYDALHDMLDPDSIPKLMAAGTIEVAPLAYMRGRAQPVHTNVLTPEGFRPIGDLEVGDLVVGSNGEPTPVLGVYPQGEKAVYRITTQDGASTLCSEDHLWSVRTRDDTRRGKPHRVLTAKEIRESGLRCAHYRKYELPLLSQPMEFPERDLPMDPYALGLLLGDGCLTGSTTPSFSTEDPELAEALEGLVPGIRVSWKQGPDYVINRETQPGDVITIANPVTAVMRDLDLCGTTSATKFVPDAYLYNSAEVRLAVLQGLLDSDGGPVSQNGRACRIQYGTASPMLSSAVRFLTQSLGGVAYARTRAAKDRKPGLARGREVFHRHDTHLLDLRLPEGVAPFRLRRKIEKYQASGGGRPMRFIDSIEPAGTEECVCIQVAAEDSLYVTEDFLLTHNTLNDSFIILDEAQNTSPEQMKMFLTRLGFGSKIVVTGDVTQVDLPGGQTSGLRTIENILSDIDDIAFCRLTSDDVVRHKLVGKIVDAYGRYDAAQDASQRRRRDSGGGRSRGGSARSGSADTPEEPGTGGAGPEERAD